MMKAKEMKELEKAKQLEKLKQQVMFMNVCIPVCILMAKVHPVADPGGGPTA